MRQYFLEGAAVYTTKHQLNVCVGYLGDFLAAYCKTWQRCFYRYVFIVLYIYQISYSPKILAPPKYGSISSPQSGGISLSASIYIQLFIWAAGEECASRVEGRDGGGGGTQSLLFWIEISEERTFRRSFVNSLEDRSPRTYLVERSDDDDADLVERGKGEGGKVGWISC